MRYNLLFLLFFSVLINARAQQNLVPNPSFEVYSSCPDYGGQINKAVGWNSYCLSPDYFVGGGCSLDPSYFVPGNAFGSQSAYGGGTENAYGGLMCSKNYMFEYMRAAIPALEVGSKYEVTIFVSPGDNCQFGNDGLGVFFFDKGDTTATVPALEPLNITPQIDYSSYGPITNRHSWTKLTSTFTADSTYDNLVIGGFKANADIVEAPVVSSLGNYRTYYYIDSVIVRKLIPTVTVSQVNSSYCSGDSVAVGYATNIPFTAGNTFTLQLSDASGDFTSPANIASVVATSSGLLKGVIPNSIALGGGYRVRIQTTNPSTISDINATDIAIGKAPIIEASSNSPVCFGRPLKLSVTSSDSTATYYWGGPNNVNTLKDIEITNAQTDHAGVHYVTASVNGCSATDSVTVVVKETPAITSLETDTLVCAGGRLHLFAASNTPGSVFSWMGPNEFTSTAAEIALPQVANKNHGHYRVVAIAPNGCISDTGDIWTNIVDLQAEFEASTFLYYGDSLTLKAPDNIAGAKYAWTGPSGFSSTEQNASIEDVSDAQNGTYEVIVTYKGCKASASKWVQILKHTKFTVIPNPNTGRFKVKGNVLKDQTINLDIVNHAGQVIYSDSLKTVRKHFEKEIALEGNLVNGIYFIRLVMEDETETLKVLIGK